MPFTFSHPAIILPFGILPKRRVSLTGLVIGSLTPDFEYFLRMRVQSVYSHILPGLFWFDLPLGLILCFLFHGVVRNQLFQNLPQRLKASVLPFTYFDWLDYFKAYWLVVVFSVLIGAGSHLLWDGFTHENGFFVLMFESLKHPFSINGTLVPAFKVAQHLSSLVGGLVIIYALWRLPQSEDQMPRTDRRYWYFIVGVTILVVMIRMLISPVFHQYGHLIVTFISAGLLSLIVVPVLLWISRRANG